MARASVMPTIVLTPPLIRVNDLWHIIASAVSDHRVTTFRTNCGLEATTGAYFPGGIWREGHTRCRECIDLPEYWPL